MNSKTSLFTNNTKSDFLKHKDAFLKARKYRMGDTDSQYSNNPSTTTA